MRLVSRLPFALLLASPLAAQPPAEPAKVRWERQCQIRRDKFDRILPPITVVVPRNAPQPVITLSDYAAGIVTTAGADADCKVTGVRVGTQSLTFRAVSL
jgi:hypothetical protein